MAPSSVESPYKPASNETPVFQAAVGVPREPAGKVDVFKVVKTRQNLIYIQRENTKTKAGGCADESLSETDLQLRQHHLEIPAFQHLLERTARRMKEMNLQQR